MVLINIQFVGSSVLVLFEVWSCVERSWNSYYLATIHSSRVEQSRWSRDTLSSWRTNKGREIYIQQWEETQVNIDPGRERGHIFLALGHSLIYGSVLDLGHETGGSNFIGVCCCLYSIKLAFKWSKMIKTKIQEDTLAVDTQQLIYTRIVICSLMVIGLIYSFSDVALHGNKQDTLSGGCNNNIESKNKWQ